LCTERLDTEQTPEEESHYARDAPLRLVMDQYWLTDIGPSRM